MSFTMMVITGASAVIAGLAALWARASMKALRAERDEVKTINEAMDAAGKRLEAARQANQKPIDPKRRDDFEGQP